MVMGNKLIKQLGVLSLFGGITALPLMIAFAVTGWGAPGTTAYRTYELLNRLMAFSLLLMVAGWLGLALRSPSGYGRWGAWLALFSSLVMVVGNAAEFWLFSDLSYNCCNVRHVTWSTFLLGLLVTAVGATFFGMAYLRTGQGPRWSGFLLVFALPLFVIGFGFAAFLGPSVLALAVGWLLVTTPSPFEVHSKVPM